MRRMAARAIRLRLGSQDGNRYSIIPIPEDISLAMKISENMKGLIDRMEPQAASALACAKHPDKQVVFNCRTCRNLLICDRCQSQDHGMHSTERIDERYQTIRNRLRTAKRNMDKINDRCKIVNDENQNEENQVVSLFDKLQADFKDSQDVLFRRLERDEERLVEYEKDELKTITFSREADERLYEVEAIERITKIEEQIEALEREKKAVKGRLEARLKERENKSSEKLDALKEELIERRKSNKEIEEQLATNADIFDKIYRALESVSEDHAAQCRETISRFLERYREVTSQVAAFENGTASFQLLQELADLSGESDTDATDSNMNGGDIAQDSFVLEIPQVHYRPSDGGSLELGYFVLYPGDEEQMKFTWARSNQEKWYVENISGLSNQLIAVVSRKRGSRETSLDILTQSGELLVSYKLAKSSADSFHFVCAVSPHRVATCCECEINLMNIDNGKIEGTHKLSRGDEAWQIAYNRTRKEILVGVVGLNELRVFDDCLLPLRTIRMSTTFRAPLSLAASGDHIFVCTYENRAFVLDGKDGGVRTTFNRNGLENRAWRICCDSLGMVYVMWLLAEGVVSVIRYDVNGDPYSCLDVDSRIRFLSFALIQNGAEQLIVASEEGEFYINRTPSKVEDAMVRAVDNISLSNYLGVRSIWRPM